MSGVLVTPTAKLPDSGGPFRMLTNHKRALTGGPAVDGP